MFFLLQLHGWGLGRGWETRPRWGQVWGRVRGWVP